MASVWFILLSFMGKLSALIHAVPSAVIGGVFAVVCVIILLSGFRVIKNEEFSERELYIIGVPLIIAIGLLFYASRNQRIRASILTIFIRFTDCFKRYCGDHHE